MAMKPEFSIIITSYYEEKSIDEFATRLIDTMRKTGRSFELVMVNDGSTDSTFERLKSLFEEHSEISHIVDLFRNSGQIAAMSCGITHAIGKFFIFMDSDLQLFPEELPLLIDKIDEGYDIVSGARKNRAEGILRTIPSKIANSMMRKIASHPITDFGCTFKIYNSKLVNAFGFGPQKKWKTAFVFKAAEKVAEVQVTQVERKYGKSGWTFRKLSEFLFDHVVGLSSRPFLILATISLSFGALIGIRIISGFFFPGGFLSNVSNGLILNLTLFSVFLNLSGFAAVGEYIFRTYQKSEKDPIYIEKTHIYRNTE